MAVNSLWRPCVKWMCELEVLPKRHKLVSGDVTEDVLALTLRDGVILCKIANSLVPGCIDEK